MRYIFDHQDDRVPANFSEKFMLICNKGIRIYISHQHDVGWCQICDKRSLTFVPRNCCISVLASSYIMIQQQSRNIQVIWMDIQEP